MDVDKLANFIRKVNGNNTMGAGALADEIVMFLAADITAWAKWIVQHRKEYDADHACAQCRPESEIVVSGFVCQYHQALAHLARKG